MKYQTLVLIALALIGIFVAVAAVYIPQVENAYNANEIALTEAPDEASQAGDQTKTEITEAPQQTLPLPLISEAPLVLPEPSVHQSVTLLFAGDVMAHQKQLDSHKLGSSYDFTGDYQYIKDIVSKADIALVNLETPMSGKTPKGAPRFNAPDNLADALVGAGFDIIATANNHIRDQNDEAMKRTSSVLKSKGLGVIGTALKEGDAKYALVEKNGINVGFVNFTVSLNRGLSAACEPYVNCLRRNGKYDEGYRQMDEQIKALNQQGAEFIVVFMHWGSEYQLKGNSTQQKMAKQIADLGADLIIGGHPHVLQDVAEYTSPVTGKNVLIYYSLGNLISNQPYSYGAGRGNCETGALAMIKLLRQPDGRVAIDSAGYLTTYAHKPNTVKEYTQNGKTHKKSTRAYYIVPAAKVIVDTSAFEGAGGTLLSHIKQGIKNAQKQIGVSAGKLQFFKFQEFIEWPWV